MLCFYCKNRLQPKKITYNINRQGYDVILREVPAFVCRECGEMFFEEKSVDHIQSLIKDVDKKAATVRNYQALSEKIKPVLSFS